MQIKNYEEIKQDILGRIDNVNKTEGSFADVLVSSPSLEIETLYNSIALLHSKFFLENLTTEELEHKAGDYGLVRKQGTYAMGKVSIDALKSTVIENGALVSTKDGLNYIVQENIEFGTEKEIEVTIKAEEIGNKYNVQANTINNMPVSITGVKSITNKEEIKGGTNIETDEELLERLLIQLRTPATSGNALHYKIWAKEVDGIADAKVFPLWNGNGTVQVIPITTEKRAPNIEKISDVRIKIEEERPIGANVTITAPEEIKININATIAAKMNADIENIQKEYIEKVEEYIKNSVFSSNVIDYNKLVALFYNIAGVESVTELKINGIEKNIIIEDKQIQVVGEIKVIENA